MRAKDIRDRLLAGDPPAHLISLITEWMEEHERDHGHDDYQRDETSEECEREMRRLSNGERGCQDPQAHERADRLARIAAIYPEAGR